MASFFNGLNTFMPFYIFFCLFMNPCASWTEMVLSKLSYCVNRTKVIHSSANILKRNIYLKVGFIDIVTWDKSERKGGQRSWKRNFTMVTIGRKFQRLHFQLWNVIILSIITIWFYIYRHTRNSILIPYNTENYQLSLLDL